MAKEYTKNDLINNDHFFSTRLRTQVLAEFYTDNLASKAYIYVLSNNEIIHLLFDNDQFCHLLGFSYFRYNGISGWHSLYTRNILVSNLQQIAQHKREEIRITNFPKIIRILDNPTMYIYKNTNMRYKANYFAVWNDGIRYYKLGIGTSSNGINYGETYQVSLIQSNDNKEIDPNNLLTVHNKFTIPKETFKNLYFPVHITAKKQKKQIAELNSKPAELQKLQWEIIINTSTY